MSYTHSKRSRKRRRREISKSPAAGSRRSSSGTRRIDATVSESSGNVFEDLGFSKLEARYLVIRSDLMIRIADLIRRRKLTQAQAAELFHVTQPRISDLMRGKIELFSIDNLIAMLGRAGINVEIRLKPKAA